MSTRNDYTADEWRAISTAPAAAGLVIALSDVGACITAADGPVVIDRAMKRTPFGDVPEIVKVLVDDAKRHDGQPEVPEIGAADRARITETLIAIVRTAVGAVEAQSPAEAEPFKAWLASVAAKVLQAAKVAAAPVPGATPVTPAEQNIINRLADVLAARDCGPVGSRTHSTPAITPSQPASASALQTGKCGDAQADCTEQPTLAVMSCDSESGPVLFDPDGRKPIVR